jgi:hypothetical protein
MDRGLGKETLRANIGIGRARRNCWEAPRARFGGRLHPARPAAILPAAGHFLPCARCALRHARFHPTLHGMQPTDDAICQLERLTSRRWRLFEDHRKGPLPGDTTVVSIKAHRGGAADNRARVSPDHARREPGIGLFGDVRGMIVGRRQAKMARSVGESPTQVKPSRRPGSECCVSRRQRCHEAYTGGAWGV